MSEQISTFANENNYLAFRYMGFDFVIPLTDITRVEMDIPAEARLLPGAAEARCYIISGRSGKLLAIGADEIYGLVNIPVEHQYELPPEVLDDDNKWIFGAAYIEDENRTVYMLDGHALSDRIEDEKDDNEI